MRIFAILLTCLSTVGAGSVVEAASLTPQTIAARVEAHGAKATLWQIYDNANEWSALLKGISSGTVAWLKIANLFHPVSDAGASQELQFAVGEALERHPDNVLRIAVPVFDVSDVCDGPDVDDFRYNSYESATQAVDRRKLKLRSVSDASLLKLRDECIRTLEDSKTDLARIFGGTGGTHQ